MSITFKRKIRRWGGSYVFVLPEELMTALKLELRNEVELTIKDNQLVATKIPAAKPIYHA